MACYVAPYGDDTNGDGTIGKPFATVSKAQTVIEAEGTIYLRGGTYAEQLSNVLPANCTLKAYNSEAVTLQPAAGAGFVISASGSNYYNITIEGLILDAVNCDYDAFKMTVGAHDFVLINCELKNATGHGALCSSAAYNMTLRNCLIHDNGVTGADHGVYMSGTTGLLADGCTIYSNNPGWGIHIYHKKDDAVHVVRNCSFYDNSIDIGAFQGSVLAYNNVSYHAVSPSDALLSPGYALVEGYFYHNTAIDCLYGVYCYQLAGTNPAVIDVAQNVFYSNDNNGVLIKDNNEAGVVFDLTNNLINGNGSDVTDQSAGNVTLTETGTVSQAFSPVDGSDPTLPTTGNPAIGAGGSTIAIPAIFNTLTSETEITTDYTGATRPDPPTLGAKEP